MATKQVELRAEGTTLCYLLTDPDGLRLLLAGTIPDYLLDQARSALEWSLEDCGQKAANW